MSHMGDCHSAHFGEACGFSSRATSVRGKLGPQIDFPPILILTKLLAWDLTTHFRACTKGSASQDSDSLRLEGLPEGARATSPDQFPCCLLSGLSSRNLERATSFLCQFPYLRPPDGQGPPLTNNGGHPQDHAMAFPTYPFTFTSQVGTAFSLTSPGNEENI